jgi:hypothetical protein
MDNNNDSCKNIDLRNLINFSIYSDIKILEKKNKQCVKNKKRILKDSDFKIKEPDNKNDISNLVKLNKINLKKYIECYSNE